MQTCDKSQNPSAMSAKYLSEAKKPAYGRDASGEWVVEMDGRGAPIKAAEPCYMPTSGYGSAFVAEGTD